MQQDEDERTIQMVKKQCDVKQQEFNQTRYTALQSCPHPFERQVKMILMIKKKELLTLKYQELENAYKNLMGIETDLHLMQISLVFMEMACEVQKLTGLDFGKSPLGRAGLIAAFLLKNLKAIPKEQLLKVDEMDAKKKQATEIKK